jgi:hypothetical protein
LVKTLREKTGKLHKTTNIIQNSTQSIKTKTPKENTGADTLKALKIETNK